MKPFWVTFYSYKGGVGRSLALANTAALLVQRGRRVLLIDFDLEAPGLDSFVELKSASGKPGVVEYVSEFQRIQAAPDIRSFVHHCDLPGPLRGQLHVMPAGRRDAAYNHQLAHINWTELYESGLGAPFFANWKAAINQYFQPDYVFIDSRTGLTEVGGVCTTQFPDLVMMLFALNEQNVCGVGTVAQSIRDANPDNVSQIHFVATPVPNLPSGTTGSMGDSRAQERRGLLTERMDAAAKHLGIEINSTIRYYSLACLIEKLYVLEEGFTRQPVYNDYKALSDQITDFNRTGIDFLSQQATEVIREGNTDRMERLAAVLERDYPDRAEAVYIHARFAIARNDIAKATLFAEKAIERDPAYDAPFSFLVTLYTRTKKFDRVLELLNAVLARPNLLSPERSFDLEHDRAQTLMTLGRHEDATRSYGECFLYVSKNNLSPTLSMVMGFNYLEATRRSTRQFDHEGWSRFVKDFGEAGNLTDASAPLLANRWEAMHIAYACIGDRDAAKDALRKSRRAAERVGEIEEIFTATLYRYVPVSEFLAINEKLLSALDQGALWDGMKIPAEQN